MLCLNAELISVLPLLLRFFAVGSSSLEASISASRFVVTAV